MKNPNDLHRESNSDPSGS